MTCGVATGHYYDIPVLSLYGTQFRAKGTLPSQAREGSLLALNWTATVTCHF
ncbi:hypothetical protein PILCRDRAFT_16050 [Piloderma croceum F 1598]|uniref:Uncharacterized protein n=1 Tax=Piloderma croceum (strain F 1598) TaxID=765440 RepID=A0A0C3B5I0_PILCF|nr:hypothetical protein PILCRDRAFT_16050 [Piloderma croceum F 1598]